MIAEKIRSEIPPVANQANYIDLSPVDFDTLKSEFDKMVEAQKLGARIAKKLAEMAEMVKLNRTRMDFLEEFQKIVDEYNAGAANVEAFFAKLMIFMKKLNEEEKRGIAENLTEEKLALFDLLTKADVNLTRQ